MRVLFFSLVLAASLVVPAHAQAVRDEEEVATTFEFLTTLAHLGDIEAALPLVACPPTAQEGPATVPCDGTLALHRVLAEWKLARLRHLFDEGSTAAALHPHYAVSESPHGDIHHLLFEDLPNATFVLLVFADLNGIHRLADVKTDAAEGAAPPPTLVATFEALLDAARDESTTPETFAPLVVARGRDAERAWKAPADPSDEAERRYVAGLLESLRALLAVAEGHTVVGYESLMDKEGWWHALRVTFEGPGEPPRLLFAFLPIGPSFLVGDVQTIPRTARP